MTILSHILYEKRVKRRTKVDNSNKKKQGEPHPRLPHEPQTLSTGHTGFIIFDNDEKQYEYYQ